MIAKIDPRRVARRPTSAFSKFPAANQHHGLRLLEIGSIAYEGEERV
jgi:hypothetical protein